MPQFPPLSFVKCFELESPVKVLLLLIYCYWWMKPGLTFYSKLIVAEIFMRTKAFSVLKNSFVNIFLWAVVVAMRSGVTLIPFHEAKHFLLVLVYCWSHFLWRIFFYRVLVFLRDCNFICKTNTLWRHLADKMFTACSCHVPVVCCESAWGCIWYADVRISSPWNSAKTECCSQIPYPLEISVSSLASNGGGRSTDL